MGGLSLGGIIKAVAPVASFIPGIGVWGKVLGAAGGAIAAGDAAKQAKEYGKNADASLALQKFLQDEAKKSYLANEKAGAYDPTNRVKLLEQDYGKLLGASVGTAAGNAASWDYKRGDSPVADAIAAIRDRNALGFAKAKQQVTDQARELKYSDLARIAGIGNPLQTAGVYGNMQEAARPDSTALQGIIGGLGSILTTPNAPKPGTPNLPASSPGGQAPGSGMPTQIPVGFDFRNWNPDTAMPKSGLDPALLKKLGLAK